MKTLAQSLADAEAALAPLGAAAAIVHGDYLAVLTDLVVAMQAGVRMRLPSQGATPLEGSLSGASWQVLGIWSTGDAVPAAGGRGLVPNLSAGTLTVETGGDGWYQAKYQVGIKPEEECELAIERDRSGAKTQWGEAPANAGVWTPCGAPDAFKLEVGDVVRVVGRTAPATECDWQIRSAQIVLVRVLPSDVS